MRRGNRCNGCDGCNGCRLPSRPSRTDAPSHRRTCTRAHRTRCTRRTHRTRCTRCAPDDPLDRVIDLGEPRDLEVDPSAFATNEERQSPPRALNRPWSARRRRSSTRSTPPNRSRAAGSWPIAVAFLAVAIIAALSVGWFLRWRAAGSVTETPTGVDATIVDLPASAPQLARRSARQPAACRAQARRGQARTRCTRRTRPAPTPSRPASGAVERTPTGSMLIRSTPADADVLVNGKPRGKTPVALRDLALGSYTIRVARDGYATEERTLQLTAQRPTTSTTINLRRRRNAYDTPGVPAKR